MSMHRIYPISRGLRCSREMDRAIGIAARTRGVTEAQWMREAIGTVLAVENVTYEPAPAQPDEAA
jgi:hypothetical protein